MFLEGRERMHWERMGDTLREYDIDSLKNRNIQHVSYNIPFYLR